MVSFYDFIDFWVIGELAFKEFLFLEFSFPEVNSLLCNKFVYFVLAYSFQLQNIISLLFIELEVFFFVGLYPYLPI